MDKKIKIQKDIDEKCKQFNKACDYLKENFECTVKFKRCAVNPNFESAEKFNFLVTLENEYINDSHSFHFSQSHKEPLQIYRKLADDKLKYEREELKLLNEYPDMWSFLQCMVNDSNCLEYDFLEWCENMGFDSDSKAVEKVYKMSIKQTKKITKLIDLDIVSEYLQEKEQDAIADEIIDEILREFKNDV